MTLTHTLDPYMGIDPIVTPTITTAEQAAVEVAEEVAYYEAECSLAEPPTIVRDGNTWTVTYRWTTQPDQTDTYTLTEEPPS